MKKCCKFCKCECIDSSIEKALAKVEHIVSYEQLDWTDASSCSVVELFGELRISYPMDAIGHLDYETAHYTKREKKWSGMCRLLTDCCQVKRYYSIKNNILYIGVAR